ncbi:hypothetical protein FHG87_007079 [Trinorchestia longiramus]|nr:hypothetical protein FHG87_007079 [Trinorchestia longiramus]
MVPHRPCLWQPCFHCCPAQQWPLEYPSCSPPPPPPPPHGGRGECSDTTVTLPPPPTPPGTMPPVLVPVIKRCVLIVSRGFSNLFVLSKADLHETIRDYPQAQEVLRKKARRLLKQTMGDLKQKVKPEDDVLIKEREGTPKLMKAVLQAVRQDSFTASVIRRSSRSLTPFAASGSNSPCPLHSAIGSTSSLNNLLSSYRGEEYLHFEDGLMSDDNSTVVQSETAARGNLLAVPCLGCREDERRRAIRDAFGSGHSETGNASSRMEHGDTKDKTSVAAWHDLQSPYEQEENIALKRNTSNEDQADIRSEEWILPENNFQLEATNDKNGSHLKRDSISLRPRNLQLSNPISLTPIGNVLISEEPKKIKAMPRGFNSCYVINVNEATDNSE